MDKVMRKIKEGIKNLNGKQKLGIISGIILLILLVTVPFAFASLTPVKSVFITSEKLNYQEQEPGSWQIEKSAEWTGVGKARITFDLDTILRQEGNPMDIIFVLDISGSMTGDKLTRVKEDAAELIDTLLSTEENRAALITFETGSTLVSDFTNDKEYLLNEINNLSSTGSTNYYQPLKHVESILKNYQKEENRDTIVLFLTDGYPNVDIPNQIAEYEFLKDEYPWLVINGVQYEMGEAILDPIKQISDNQFLADMETLNNVLFDASVIAIPYESFTITDYIDDTYFEIASIDKVQTSIGEASLTYEGDTPKVTWTIDSLRSGSSATMTIDVTLKEEYLDQGGTYPTNKKEEITSKIEEIEEDITSEQTPVLADNYKVIYDGNAPSSCVVENVPSEENHGVFTTIGISEEEPSCEGWSFKGWVLVTEGVTKVNDDYFIMPEKDVILRAEWGQVSITKSMDGTVNEMGDPIMRRYTQNSTADYHNSTYKSNITSIVTKNDIMIPSDVIEWWDVSAAGDGSVIAYIEDDGRGEGTYKVTIGGTGGIIANQRSIYLFYNFTGLESIDLTYLDASKVTNMDSIFYNCSSLESITFGESFDTSSVTDMSYMFYHCSNLTSLELSSFDTSNVVNMSYMFNNCSSLTSLDLSSFNTTNVTTMSYMFSGCRNLQNIIFGENFDTTNVTDMYGMFYGCRSLASLDLSGFDTSSVTNMSYMFQNCRNLQSITFGGGFNTTNVANMSDMFSSCSSLESITFGERFDTSRVTNMEGMFSSCSSLESITFGESFNTSNVTDMRYMFYSCSSLTNLDLSSFNTSSVTNMSSMFSWCSSLERITFGENFNTSQVTSMSSMFEGCSSLTSLDLSGFDTSKVTKMDSMFSFCSSLTSLNLSSFDTSQATSMSLMFSNCSRLSSLDLSNFDTSQAISMSYMFQNCSSLTSLDMRNATFNATGYSGIFNHANSSINVIVKDETAKTWIETRLSEASITGGTVTIASTF